MVDHRHLTQSDWSQATAPFLLIKLHWERRRARSVHGGDELHQKKGSAVVLQRGTGTCPSLPRVCLGSQTNQHRLMQKKQHLRNAALLRLRKATPKGRSRGDAPSTHRPSALCPTLQHWI